MYLDVDGHKIFAATGGRPFDPALPTVVFLHGASLDHTVWILQSRYFAWHGRGVLAVDLPAHGRSDGEPLDSIEAMSDWVIRLLDAAGVEKAALVGHSMGSLVALDAAARHGERVTALAMLGTGFPMRVTDVLLDAAEAGEERAFDMMTIWGFGHSAQVGQHQMPGLWMVKGGNRLFHQRGPNLLHTDLLAGHVYEGGVAAAAAVGCPALCVIGSDDMMTPRKSGLALAEKIAGAQVVEFPASGHIMLAEYPNETLDALRRVI